MLNFLYKYFCCCFKQSERYISFSDHDWTDIYNDLNYQDTQNNDYIIHTTKPSTLK